MATLIHTSLLVSKVRFFYLYTGEHGEGGGRAVRHEGVTAVSLKHTVGNKG
jgi:hypothetical protein